MTDEILDQHKQSLRRISEEFFPSQDGTKEKWDRAMDEVYPREIDFSKMPGSVPIHDWVPTGHETLACQFEGCGMSPLGGDKATFYAVHRGPMADFYKPVVGEGWSDGAAHPGREF